MIEGVTIKLRAEKIHYYHVSLPPNATLLKIYLAFFGVEVHTNLLLPSFIQVRMPSCSILLYLRNHQECRGSVYRTVRSAKGKRTFFDADS